VGQDAYTDIAVIKVDASMPAIAQFGDSNKLEPGQPVVAIGTALGDFENTVTAGIVSGLHRQLEDGGTSLQDLIQTDAAVNHGNSGGALLDLDGNVVGINTAVVRIDGTMGSVAEGLGFAIPSNTARAVAEQLIGNGAISHPYIGISYQPITPELAAANNLPTQQGLYVTDVAAGSPAAQAGIKPNSIITKLDSVALGSDGNSNLVTLLSKHKVGDSVKLGVIAPGSSTESDVTIVLATRPGGQ
jgi:2-alkenal reductase